MFGKQAAWHGVVVWAGPGDLACMQSRRPKDKAWPTIWVGICDTGRGGAGRSGTQRQSLRKGRGEVAGHACRQVCMWRCFIKWANEES